MLQAEMVVMVTSRFVLTEDVHPGAQRAILPEIDERRQEQANSPVAADGSVGNPSVSDGLPDSKLGR